MKKIFAKISIILLLLPAFLISKARAADTSPTAFLNSGAYNNIIDDGSFVDVGSMDANAIQQFLVNSGSYLASYTDSSCSLSDCQTENGKSAAQIIYDAAKGLYPAAIGSNEGIDITASTGTVSPKIILIFLQKEQGLITNPARNDYGLTYAMGYGCSDSTGCPGSSHPGFSEQVGWGAWQLRYNFEAAKQNLSWWQAAYQGNPGTYFYVGGSQTLSDYTGTYNLTFADAATASNYRYTPHVFDSAYNVWQFWNTWSFPASGAPPPPARKSGDANGDNGVDLLDLSILASQWGQGVTANTGADFNGDGKVDLLDLSILASAWGS